MGNLLSNFTLGTRLMLTRDAGSSKGWQNTSESRMGALASPVDCSPKLSCKPTCKLFIEKMTMSPKLQSEGRWIFLPTILKMFRIHICVVAYTSSGRSGPSSAPYYGQRAPRYESWISKAPLSLPSSWSTTGITVPYLVGCHVK